jgi:hypothetical protein
VVAIQAVVVVTGDEKTSSFHNLTLLKSRNSGRYLVKNWPETHASQRYVM